MILPRRRTPAIPTPVSTLAQLLAVVSLARPLSHSRMAEGSAATALWHAQLATGGGIALTGSPAAITYNHEGKQWVHAFVMGADGRLYTNYYNGFCWQWAAVPYEPLRKGLSDCPLTLTRFASRWRAEIPQ